MPEITLHVVDQIDHTDLGRGPVDADGSDEQLHVRLLAGEDMLNMDAHFRAPAIGPGHSLAHRPTLGLFVMNVGEIAILGEPGLVLFRSVCGIGPHRRSSVAAVEHIAKLSAVISRCAGHIPAPDEAMAPINGCVVLVAKGRNRNIALLGPSFLLRLGLGELHRPASIPVLLAQLGGLVFPIIRNLASLDTGLFAVSVALLGCRHDRGINDLPAHRQITLFGKMLVETGEQNSQPPEPGSGAHGTARSSWHRELYRQGKAQETA